MITICLGFRAWHHEHLRHALDALARLDLPIVVVDASMHMDTVVADLCTYSGARYVSAPWHEWSRARALNAAAQHVSTSHVCFTDADMLFPRSWRPHAERALRIDPHTLWLTHSRDLDALATRATALGVSDLGLELLSTAHPDVGHGAGMLVDLAWFRRVGGFDEFYSVWGAEDNDLVLRAHWDGKSVDWIPNAFVAHQYHRRDWPTPAQMAQVQRNRDYLRARIDAKGPIVRNVKEKECAS